jgi:hypothetical protein
MGAGRCRPSATLGVVALCSFALLLGSAPLALAGAPEIAPTFPSCVPSDGNAVVEVTLRPEAGWASVRTYFKASGNPDYYFLEMRAAGQGKYFTVIPKPVSDTKAVDLHVEVRDGENALTRSAEKSVAVNSTCKTALNDEQKKVAQNLVAGETKDTQRDKEILGFQCEGVVSRIDSIGVLRPDEACRRAAILAATQTAVLIPALVVGAGGAVIIINKHEKKETSPSH